MKTFDVKAAQGRALGARIEMKGCKFKHYKGGEYIVMGVDVDEATGQVRVTYWSIDRNHYWSRSLDEFAEMVEVDGKQIARFRKK